MTREEYVAICRNCAKVKQSDKGLICSLTNQYADFDKNCPNYTPDPKKIEENKNRQHYKLTGWWNFVYYFFVPIGALYSIADIFQYGLLSGYWPLCFIQTFVIAYAVYLIVCYAKRRPNTPFLSFVYFGFLLFYVITAPLANGIHTFHLMRIIVPIIWYGCIIGTLIWEKDYQDLFPKAKRTITRTSWCMASLIFLSVALILIFCCFPPRKTIQTDSFSVKFPPHYEYIHDSVENPICADYLWAEVKTDGYWSYVSLQVHEYEIPPSYAIVQYAPQMLKIFQHAGLDESTLAKTKTKDGDYLYFMYSNSIFDLGFRKVLFYALNKNGRTFVFSTTDSHLFEKIYNAMKFKDTPPKDWTMEDFFMQNYGGLRDDMNPDPNSWCGQWTSFSSSGYGIHYRYLDEEHKMIIYHCGALTRTDTKEYFINYLQSRERSDQLISAARSKGYDICFSCTGYYTQTIDDNIRFFVSSPDAKEISPEHPYAILIRHDEY